MTDPDIVGLTSDSRQVRAGYLFAALAGAKTDGSKFIRQAEESGAVAILAKPGARAELPIVFDERPRARFSDMAARFFSAQPDLIAGITGTNGKTSTALFTAQLWSLMGARSGSVGTLGVRSERYNAPLVHTTPEPVTLHDHLSKMAMHGVTHAALEISSHGLDQHRADGVRFSIAAFTNLTQDHLDYHLNFDHYRAAKDRLFAQLLPAHGICVVNADGDGADHVIDIGRKAGLATITTGVRGRDLKIGKVVPTLDGLEIEVVAGGAHYELSLPLIGAFQAENALLAAGIVCAAGAHAKDVLPLLEKLNAAPGRMEHAGSYNGAAIYVDYAHTPAAVATALKELRPHGSGRLIVILGAGGDRDRSKRSLMGEAAHSNADVVIVTDDNPRSEDPAGIRADILAAAPGAQDYGDRAYAISVGIAMLAKGDVLLVAGKGHENGQDIGGQILPFNDVACIKETVDRLGMEAGK